MAKYYYKYDILCHEYIRGGVIRTDLYDYLESDEDVKDCAEEYIVERFGEEQLEDLDEWGGFEVKITLTNDPKFKGTDIYSEDDELDYED